MPHPAEQRVPRLVATTREIDPLDDLLPHSDAHAPLVWSRRGDGHCGWGETLRLDVHGADRIARLARTWAAVSEIAEVDDAVGLPGSGLTAFGAFAFDDRSARPSTLIVPAAIVGRRGGRTWATLIHDVDEPAPEPRPRPLGPYWPASLGRGAQSPEDYQAAVRAAVARIAQRAFEKVVLARDLVGTVPADADLRRLVRALATEYPDCWTYAADGIIGASPETLVTVTGGTMTARVLAGTAARGADTDTDTAAAVALATSAKDLDEHEYAVQSVLAALRPHTAALAASEQPFTLKLPNVWHLATDVEGALSNAATALDLASALHPTAAVAGSPTHAALDAIRTLEPFDRGRYAGPVGWVDSHGDGEWAIALRCAQFAAAEGDARAVVAHAGAGIVAGSQPESELLETRVKFRPIVDAIA